MKKYLIQPHFEKKQTVLERISQGSLTVMILVNWDYFTENLEQKTFVLNMSVFARRVFGLMFLLFFLMPWRKDLLDFSAMQNKQPKIIMGSEIMKVRCSNVLQWRWHGDLQ